MGARIQTFEEFFRYYLGQHSLPATRALHYIGTTLFLASLVAFVVTLQWPYLLFALFIGYFFAWIGHFFVEKNRPATFTYPLWSFIGDLKMYFLFVTGQIDRHLEAAGVGVVSTPEPEPEPNIASDPEPTPTPDPDPEPRQE